MTTSWRAAPRPRLRLSPGGHHVSRSRLHLGGGAVHHGRSAPHGPADERRVQRVHARVLAVRNAVGMAWRRARPAPRADPHRAVVVGVHDADRRGARAIDRSSPSAFCSARERPGAFPNIVRSFSRWFPLRERGRANGVMFLGSRVGGMLSVPIALLLIDRWGWRCELRRRSARSAWSGRRRGSRGIAIARPNIRRRQRRGARVDRTGWAASRTGQLPHAVARRC